MFETTIFHFLMRPAVDSTAASLGHSCTNRGNIDEWKSKLVVGIRQRVDRLRLPAKGISRTSHHPIIHQA
jgi:hypothetical protein